MTVQPTPSATVAVVFGGSSFMGRDLIDTLVDPATTSAVHGVVQLNRGHGYWGTPSRNRAESGVVQPAGNVFHAWVHHDFDDGGDAETSDSDDGAATAAGRNCRDETASALGDALRAVAEKLQAAQINVCVIAFSLDCAAHATISVQLVRQAIARLVGEATGVEWATMGQYVLISSDSAYDPRKVARSGAVALDGNGTLPERDALLYDEDPHPSRRYGVCKAAIEHALRRQLCCGGVSTTTTTALAVLRLPDVFGPRDNTGRWWATQLWGTAEPQRCYFPASLQHRWISVVFSRDVVAAVMAIIARIDPSSGVSGALHVASPPILLTDFVTDILRQGDPAADVIVVSPVRRCAGSATPSSSSSDDDLTSDDGEDACDFYPSVDVPPLDTSAAARLLGFSATPLDMAVSITGAFYRSNALSKHRDDASIARQRQRALEKLPRWVRIALRRSSRLP